MVEFCWSCSNHSHVVCSYSSRNILYIYDCLVIAMKLYTIRRKSDNNHPRFANLRTGGNMPRKRPGLVRDAISLLLIIAMCVAFYVVTP